jgi:hypothetical protein
MDEVKKLLDFIDSYYGVSPMIWEYATPKRLTDEEICNLCCSVSVLGCAAPEKEYLKVLHFITEDGYKFGMEPYFFENTPLFSDFVSIYTSFEAGDPDKAEFFDKVREMAYTPDFRNSFPGLDRLIRDAINNRDYEVLEWLSGDWDFELVNDGLSQDFLGAVRTWCLFNSDIEDIPSYGDSSLRAYLNAFSLAETPEEVRFFNAYREKVKASFPELQ